MFPARSNSRRFGVTTEAVGRVKFQAGDERIAQELSAIRELLAEEVKLLKDIRYSLHNLLREVEDLG